MTVEQFKAVTKALAILKPYAENPACRDDKGHFILMWDGAWNYEGPDVPRAVRPIRGVKPERFIRESRRSADRACRESQIGL